MTSQDIYVATEIHSAALDQLETIARTFDPAAPDDLRTRIIEALGEIAGIWPASSFAGEDEGAFNVAA